MVRVIAIVVALATASVAGLLSVDNLLAGWITWALSATLAVGAVTIKP